MRFVLMLFSCLVAGFAPAQNRFQKYFSEPMEYQQMAYSVFDSSFILAGSRFNPGTVYDFCAVKIDRDGQVIWSKNYASPNDEFLGSCSVLPDGRILLGGYKSSLAGDNDFSLVMLNPAGSLLWHKSYGNSAFEQLIFSGADISGNLYLAGNRWSSNDPVAIKTDSNGNILWTKTYSTLQAGEQTDAALLRPDGTLIMSGDLAGGKLFLAGINTMGSQNFSHAYTTTHTQFLHSLRPAPGNGYILASTDYRCDASGCFPFLSFIRLDSAGNVTWAKAVENGLGWGRMAVATADGGFAITGQLQDTAAGDKNPVLIKVDGQGNLQWAIQYGPAGTSGETFFAEELPAGGFMVFGLENSGGYLLRTDASGLTGCTEFPKQLTLSDMNFVKNGPASLPEKTDPDFTLIPSMSDVPWTIQDSLICDVSSAGNSPNLLSLEIYPNPASSEIWVKTPFASGGMIRLFDIYGKTLLTIFADPGAFRHQLLFEGLPDGVYLVELLNQDSDRLTSKIIVRRNF